MAYPEAVLRRLEAAGAAPGDEVEVTDADGRQWRGIIMDHHEFSAADVLALKLKSGYNVGVSLGSDTPLALAAKAQASAKAAVAPLTASADLPVVAILGTGGTIASFVDYRTGGVVPVSTPDELAAAVPELVHTARVRPTIAFSMFSEDMQPEHWRQLAHQVKAEFDGGAKGVVITHGTDTMGFTAAALAFMLKDLPGPVVIVGAQRSSDRPSSDAAMNLHAAVAVAATADIGEVVVVMHATPDDDVCHIHRGVRVRKMHSSRRDAFHSINAPVLGRVDPATPHSGGTPRVTLTQPVRRATAGPVIVDDAMNERVAMIQSYPGLWPEHILDVVLDGVVLVGTGLGHVANRTFSALQTLSEQGKFVAMATQCLHGRTGLNVYATGRDLQNHGVVPCEDMLPETAYVKLMWVLAHATDHADAVRLFQTDLAGELSPRSPLSPEDAA